MNAQAALAGLEPSLVPDELVRLSVGIENVEDLWTDLYNSLG
ncbi:MAG: PLP-dependent transferase [Marmoricola sp.]